MINLEEIKNNLKTSFIGKRIICHDVPDSTNNEAFRLIDSHKARHGDLITANQQLGGKGQQGNSWTSPEGGLYVSIITVSKVCEGSNLITFVSAISCIEAIKSVTGINAGLKWVNDIIINKQKLGGILTETVTSGRISTHISGIGINANSKIENTANNGFKPVSLSELLNKEVSLNFLIAEICNSFEKYFEIYQSDKSKIIDKWLECSNIAGLAVNFMSEEKYLSGIIEGIDIYGHLIVKIEEKRFKLTSTRNLEIIYSE